MLHWLTLKWFTIKVISPPRSAFPAPAARMNIVCIGGGPAGLYFALLMKQQNPAHDITVVERNRPYDTFGWGVVFSDQTMEHMRQWDTVTADQIEQAFNHWDDIELHIK